MPRWTRQTWAIIVVGVLILTVVVALWFVNTDRATKWLALVGILISYSKVLYDWYDKERERRKKHEDSQERLKVNLLPLYNSVSGTTVMAEIYNHGLHPVHIKRVALHFRHPDGSVREIKYVNHMHSEHQILNSKETVVFSDPTMIAGLWSHIPSRAKDDVWLVVESYHGEVYKGGGESIIRAITTPQP